MNSRQIQRLENKKRKMDALMEIKSLNETDRLLKRPLSQPTEPDEKVARKKSKLTLYLKHQGESAQVFDTGLPQTRVPLFVSDVREFLLYIVFNKSCPPYCEPRWCNISKKKIENAVLLVIEGLSLNEYLKSSHEFPILRDRFVKMEVVPPSSYSTGLVQELAMSSRHREAQGITPATTNSPSPHPKSTIDFLETAHTIKSAFPISKHLLTSSKPSAKLPEPEKGEVKVGPKSGTDGDGSEPKAENSLGNKSANIGSQSDSIPPQTKSAKVLPVADKFPRTMLLLSALQMIEEDYPIPLRGELSAKFSKYINTKESYSDVTPQSPMFGLDCEMCKTAKDDKELTRVTLVDEQENVVYESLVKPYNPITNYLTPYSGITRALLAPVTTRLEHVQKALSELLPHDAILVGQSLNCDLHALKMMHPYVIDTSVIFNTSGVRSHKPKLKMLASHFLDMQIQDQESGHCSKEDAIAALKLVKLKLSKDPQFGDTVALQKCIRNINSKLSTPSEVQNLFAYFDKIVSKKKETSVEKTAIVLTTDPSAEREYKRYLQTYRTKCKLLQNPNTILNQPTLPNVNKPNEGDSKDVVVNSVDIIKSRKESNGVMECEDLKGVPIPDESLVKLTINSRKNDTSSHISEIISETKNKSKRKMPPNSCSSAQKGTNSAEPHLVDLTDVSSPPSKLKRDERRKCAHSEKLGSCAVKACTKFGINGTLNGDVIDVSEELDDDRRDEKGAVDSNVISSRGSDSNGSRRSNENCTSGSRGNNDSGTNDRIHCEETASDCKDVEMLAANVTKREVDGTAISDSHTLVQEVLQKRDEQKESLLGVSNIDEEVVKVEHTNGTVEELVSGCHPQLAKPMQQSSVLNIVDDKFIKRVEVAGKTVEEPMSQSHAQLVKEMLSESGHKSLVIGHTKLANRALLHRMIQDLEDGLTDTQLLVVLTVPECKTDKSSGVCFISANHC